MGAFQIVAPVIARVYIQKQNHPVVAQQQGKRPDDQEKLRLRQDDHPDDHPP
jgi:hypothetical protein